MTLQRPTSIVVPFEWLTTPSIIERNLARVGYVRTNTKTAANTIVKALRDGTKLPTIAFTETTGWKDDFKAYAFGRETVGRPQNPLLFMPSLAGDDARNQLAMGRAPGGSWEAWRDGTADALRCSDVMLAAICFGLASTTAGRMNVESGLVHIFAPSTSAKTLILVAVWSMFGPCNRDRLPNWNATPTGFEEMLDMVADAPFVCDELTFLEGDSDAAKNFKSLAYAIASNRRRVRSKHWTGGTGSPVRSGRTIVISNGELSLEELTAKSNRTRRLGEQCRAIDINADMETGCGVFNELPVGLDMASFARKIEASCQANYGHSGFRFIEHLVSQHAEWPVRATRSMDNFKQAAQVPSSGYARSSAKQARLFDGTGILFSCRDVQNSSHRCSNMGAHNLAV